MASGKHQKRKKMGWGDICIFDVVLRMCNPGEHMLTLRGFSVTFNIVYSEGTEICAPEVAVWTSGSSVLLKKLPFQLSCAAEAACDD